MVEEASNEKLSNGRAGRRGAVNGQMHALGAAPSAIRELFAYGLARKAEIGEENVFDFSIGNPSVPAPAVVRETILGLMEEDPVSLHGYTPAAGAPSVRRAVADHIRERYGFEASPDRVYLTTGAAAGLAISISAITVPGDKVAVVAPYFPEYRTWIEQAGCEIVEVPASVPDFQIDIAAMDAAIDERTVAIIVNSPNNPVGSVYTRESLEALAALLERKQREFDHDIFVISDEPYREITYGAEVPYVPAIWANTIVCYSYSKSLSLPGERIGYIYVSDAMKCAQEVSCAVAGAGRALGYVCAPVLFQRVLEKCIDAPSDVEAYAANRKLLSDGLAKIGYEFVEPEGAFYLWVRALEDDATAFSERAKEFELLIVPSDSFGVSGWVRLSYCIASDVIERSLPAFAELWESYRG